MTIPDSAGGKQHALDWLRVIVIANVIVFHSAWLITCIPGFSSVPRGGAVWSALLLYVLLVVPWQMPILFFIAGITSRLSLGRRQPQDYLVERLKRLLVPLAFGMLFWFPLMAYFWPGTATDRSFADYVLSYWPDCVRTIHSIELPGRPERPGWSHLWFIAYLLIISLAILPLVTWAIKALPQALLTPVQRALRLRWGIHLLSLPLIAIIATMSPKWPMYQNSLLGDWAWLTLNTVVFLYGYFLARAEYFWLAVDRHALAALLLALCCASLMVWFGAEPVLAPSYTPRYMIYAFVVGLLDWLAIIALLGLARRHLSQSNRFLRYFAPGSYALYFLHLFLMVPIGAFVTGLDLGVAMEFLLLTCATLAASLGIYELIVRRWALARFLFGLK